MDLRGKLLSQSNGVTEMYKVLTVVCVLAIIALGTSVISAVIENTTTARQSKQISNLSNQVATDRHEMSQLRAELRNDRDQVHSKRINLPHQASRLTSDGDHVITVRASESST
jgi:uncharacterized coiled-coil protein SlyX